MAGASCIQVGTANFIDPAVTMKIIDGISEYCYKNNVNKISELTGALAMN
ncbi:MAG TPA: hypothetical protein PLP11_11115 [Bacteroidales bacterium]|nr:hypothetical protein [Bacteroidales bacterium]